MRIRAGSFNIYNFASWARATLLPLAVLSARRAVRPLPPERRLDELFPDGRDKMDYRLPRRGSWLSWRRLFLFSDRFLHLYQQLGFSPGREIAINACLGWIVRHQDADGAWGGIQPPWIYSLLALHVEGYTLITLFGEGLAALDDHWSYERGGTLHIQASESPVWDTLLALLAMQDCERDAHAGWSARSTGCSRTRCATRAIGRKKVKGVEPSGWAFERANLQYPDIDDTAVALIVLARLPRACSISRGFARRSTARSRWTLAMQSTNGGWAAFDKDNDWLIITKIPFCDFGEALDPPSADVTAHVLEALGCSASTATIRPSRAGYKFLRKRAGDRRQLVRPLGRQSHLRHGRGAARARSDRRRHDAGVRSPAADWLVAHQNTDGGWGETCASYMDDSLRGTGQHGFADGLGAIGPARRQRRDIRSRDPPRRRVSIDRSATTAPGTSPTTRARASPATALAPVSTPATERGTDRAGHGAAARIHDQLQPLSALFPADGHRPRAPLAHRLEPPCQVDRSIRGCSDQPWLMVMC